MFLFTFTVNSVQEIVLHFSEFKQEKNWGVRDKHCLTFDASVFFNMRCKRYNSILKYS